jgi:hypothetical protein
MVANTAMSRFETKQTKFEITTMVALYAAVVSTISVGWHIYIYLRSGVRLGIDLTPNAQIFSGSQLGEEKFIHITIRNIGSQPTTLQKVVIFGYKNSLSYMRNKYSFIGVVPMHDHYTPALPHLLELGSTWQTRIIQTEVEKAIKLDALKVIVIGVNDSSSKKPKLNRLNIKMLSNIENI